METNSKISIRLASPKDALRIRQLITHSQIAPTFLLDGAAQQLRQVSQIVKSMSRLQWFLWDGGLFMAIPMGSWADVHVAILPEFRGKQAIDAAELLIYHMFTRTPCETLIGSTPSDNIAGIEFSRRLGFMPLMDHGGRHIRHLTLLRWMSMLQSPGDALRVCEENGLSFKAAGVRQILGWCTHGDVSPVSEAKKEES